jgi:hypothetical protein
MSTHIETVEDADVKIIPVERIRPWPTGSRRSLEVEPLQALSASLAALSGAPRITLWRVGDSYEVVQGDFYVRAARHLGQTHVATTLLEGRAGEEALTQSLIEYLHGGRVPLLEEAMVYGRLQEINKERWTPQAIASATGKDIRLVALALRILWDTENPPRVPTSRNSQKPLERRLLNRTFLVSPFVHLLQNFPVEKFVLAVTGVAFLGWAWGLMSSGW